MDPHFDFEKPIVTLEKRIEDLRELSKQEGVDLASEIRTIESKLDQLIDEVFANLTPWQRVQLSRHPNRPYFRDYQQALFPDFLELQGDRTFAEDRAIVGGTAYWTYQAKQAIPVMIIGQQKGRTTKQKVDQNFGMAKPEGYRKAVRLMELANRMKMPILTFIDTPGAYPGIETEERGQAQAIAECIRAGFALDVPVTAIVIGEGGSGGALAVGVANKVLMLEFSTYSVISPEACASILWSDAGLAERAADVLKMTSGDLARLGVIDGVIREPRGGAHRNWEETFSNVREAIYEAMFRQPKESKNASKSKKSALDFREQRLKKFRKMGQFAVDRAKSLST